MLVHALLRASSTRTTKGAWSRSRDSNDATDTKSSSSCSLSKMQVAATPSGHGSDRTFQAEPIAGSGKVKEIFAVPRNKRRVRYGGPVAQWNHLRVCDELKALKTEMAEMKAAFERRLDEMERRYEQRERRYERRIRALEADNARLRQENAELRRELAMARGQALVKDWKDWADRKPYLGKSGCMLDHSLTSCARVVVATLTTSSQARRHRRRTSRRTATGREGRQSRRPCCIHLRTRTRR